MKEHKNFPPEDVIMNDKQKGSGKKDLGPRINEQIRSLEVRLIGAEGQQYGVVSGREARSIAEKEGLDLVEVSPNSKPPVVKLIDYGKFKYEAQKKANEVKKKQTIVQLKEIQFRPNIEKHDLEVKVKRAEKFFEQGDKVRLVMQFRGREIAYKQAGMEKLNVIIDQLVEFGGVLESPPKTLGMRIMALLAPSGKIKKKTGSAEEES